MKWIKKLEVLFFNVLQKLGMFRHHHLWSASNGHHWSNDWEQLHLLSLIVQKFGFLFLPTNISELSSDSWVSQADDKRVEMVPFATANDVAPDEDHRWIQYFWVSVHWDAAFSVHTDKSLEHLIIWDPHIVKGHPAIVFAVVPQLWPHITALDSRHVLMSFKISDLHQEWNSSVCIDITIVIRNHELSHDESIVRLSAHLSRPPFGCRLRWRVDDKLVCFLVKSCCCFKSSDVWAMANFCLCIASQNIKIMNFRHPFCLLLISREGSHGRQEHRHVKPDWCLAMVWEHPEVWIKWCFGKVALVVIEIQMIELFVPHFLYLLWGVLIVLMRQGQLRIIRHIMFGLKPQRILFGTRMKDVPKLFLVEVAVCSFFQQVRRSNLVKYTSMYDFFQHCEI